MNRASLMTGFAVLTILAYGTIAQKDSKVDERALHAPTPVPDRVILTWAGNPATTQAVTWRTDTSVTNAVAQITEEEDGPLFAKKAKLVSAKTEKFVSDINEAHYHSVQFEGLKPDTVYVYRVGDGRNWSEWNQFRTAAEGDAPLEFLYVGDAQNEIWEFWSRVIRRGFQQAPQARFIIHAGDLVNRAARDAEWGEWHQAPGWINRSVVSLPTPGNHEYGAVEGKRQIAPHWRPQFTLPMNGMPGLEESTYYLDIQGVRVISLNSNERQKEQAQWLESVLANNPSRWTILTFHHPIFSAARSRDNKELRELWQPVFDKYAVDLVLTGHDHTYARSNLRTGISARSGKAGTVYVVSVSGPKMYPLTREDWMERAAEDTQLFQVIRVDGGRLHYEARTVRGVLYDAFDLQKQKDNPNLLINRAPASAENRRK